MDIRAQRTYGMLCDAMEGLLAEKDYERITVSELCARSTVRRATFYRHFEDKDDFFRYYLSTLTERFMAEVDVPEESDLLTYARSMHRALIAFMERHRDIMKRNFGQATLAGTLDMMVRQISVGISERVKREDPECPDAEFVGMFYAGGLVHTLRWWLAEDADMSADGLEERSTAILMAALGK